jgi:hypothetical protein
MEVANGSLIGQTTVSILSERTALPLRTLLTENLIYNEDASGMVFQQNQGRLLTAEVVMH